MAERIRRPEQANSHTNPLRDGEDDQGNRGACSPQSTSVPGAYRGVSFQGMTLIGRYLVHMSGRSWDLAGAHSTVEDAQSVLDRLDPRNVVVGRGLLALSENGVIGERMTSRELLLLVVEFSDESVIVTRVVPQQLPTAKAFTRRINCGSDLIERHLEHRSRSYSKTSL